jgi:hypothetical protein
LLFPGFLLALVAILVTMAVTVPRAWGASANTQNITLAYPSFTSADMSGVALTGAYAPYHILSSTPFSAYLSGAAIRLTDSGESLSGAAVFQRPISLSGGRSFSAFFAIDISNSAWSTADGMAFVLQPSSTFNVSYGGGMGYVGMPGSRPGSVAIEFDTFNNPGYDAQNGVSVPIFDPNNNHIGVDINGASQSVVTANPPGSLVGSPWNVWVEYDDAAGNLEVRMSKDMDRPAVPVLSYRIDLSQVIGSQVYAGFTASTGALHETHEIQAFYLDSTNLAGGLSPATVTYTMGAGTSSGATHNGTLVELRGGSLTLSTPMVGDFAGVTLNGMAQTSAVRMGSFTVADATGMGSGWNMTVQATQMSATAHALALGSISMPQPTVATIDRTSGGVPTITLGPYLIDNASAVKIASADSGFGMGSYTFASGDLTLSIPANAYAGTYATTVTVSVATGP